MQVVQYFAHLMCYVFIVRFNTMGTSIKHAIGSNGYVFCCVPIEQVFITYDIIYWS